jgi:AraC family transcriptional regulator, transcriptional activator of pobA
MQSKRELIPVHRLEESTDQGFELERLSAFSQEDADSLVMGLHRDDHYIFVLQESGKSRMTNDFELYSLEGNMVMFVFPGVVHGFYGIDEEVSGWFMALDPGLMPDAFRTVLEDPFLSRRPVTIEPQGMAELNKCLELIHSLKQQPASVYLRHAIYSLLASFTAMITGLYAARQEMVTGTISRAQHITRAFRKLLSEEYRTLKSPGEYAAALHLSPSYFNEAVKEATGFNVGYWIQKQIALEAKRLLYYGKCSVKEVAHELGYEDHTYFSRLFKKMVGKTPGQFRTEFGGQ